MVKHLLFVFLALACFSVSQSASIPDNQDLGTGVYIIKSRVKDAAVLTISENGRAGEYAANATTAQLDTSLLPLFNSTQLWYVQVVMSYPAENLQLRIISTRSNNDYNKVDMELPEGSSYFYRSHWRVFPAGKGTYAIEFFSQLAFGQGSGLCLQNGSGRYVEFAKCRTNKKNQQWSFTPAY